MAYNSREESVTFVTSSDMRTRQFMIVEMATTGFAVCDFATAQNGYGVVINTPNAGEAASVVNEGEVRVRCGSGGAAIGDYITSAASGWATKVFSGMAGPVKVLGRARVTAASGMFTTIDMSNRFTIPGSSAISVGGI